MNMVRLPLLLRFKAQSILFVDFGAFDITTPGVSSARWWNAAHDPFPSELLGKTGYGHIYERYYTSVSRTRDSGSLSLVMHVLDASGDKLQTILLASTYGLTNREDAYVTLPAATFSGGVEVTKASAGLQLEVVTIGTPPTVTGTLPRPLSIIF